MYKQPTQQTIDKYERLINQAVRALGKTTYGKFLLERFPLHLTSTTEYAKENDVLLETGSPACTDGIDVYVSALTTAAFFENAEFKQWDRFGYTWGKDSEELWRVQTTDKPMTLSDNDIMREIYDIILHEYTHAINKHSKLQRAAAKKSDLYRQKLAVACEIQANDGLMGREYQLNYSQQPEGVTNKRMHPETIGKHTLTDIIKALKLDTRDGQGSSASKSSQASQKMMDATGAGEKWDREIQNEAKASDQGSNKDSDKDDGSENANEGGMMGGERDEMTKTASENVVEQLKNGALQNIKKLILSAISKELSYDADTNSVVYNQIKHRETSKTYSRPSKRQSNTVDGVELLRKGIRRKRVIDYEESNDLLVLAVDASGSMQHQERYVSAILDDLMEQVDKVCKENDVTVHWENLLATLHEDDARTLVSVKSEEWARTMRNYRAGGGNDFDCVLRQIKNQLIVREQRSYDSITVLNLSDGMDVLDSVWDGTELEPYIREEKLRWVDALIGDKYAINEAANAMNYDKVKIREQIVLACDYI